MKSPFPGMDPYMERRWRGVHGALIVYSTAALNAVLSPDLRAESEERLVIELPGVEPRDILPDVYAWHHAGRDAHGADGNGAAAATVAPTITAPLRVPAETPRAEPYITVVESRGGTVVTVIEFVSPTNKYAGPERDRYEAKRRDVVAAGLNFVEVDLTRAGPRLLPMEVARVPAIQSATYHAFARRGFGAAVFDVYPIPLPRAAADDRHSPAPARPRRPARPAGDRRPGLRRAPLRRLRLRRRPPPRPPARRRRVGRAAARRRGGRASRELIINAETSDHPHPADRDRGRLLRSRRSVRPATVLARRVEGPPRPTRSESAWPAT